MPSPAESPNTQRDVENITADLLAVLEGHVWTKNELHESAGKHVRLQSADKLQPSDASGHSASNGGNLDKHSAVSSQVRVNQDHEKNRASTKKSAKWNTSATTTIRTTLGGANAQKRTARTKASPPQDVSTAPEVSSDNDDLSGSNADQNVESAMLNPANLELQRPHDASYQVSVSSRASNGSFRQDTQDLEKILVPEKEGPLSDRIVPVGLSLDTSTQMLDSSLNAVEDSDVQVLSQEIKQNGTSDTASSSQKDKQLDTETAKMATILTLKEMSLSKRDLQRRYFNITDNSGVNLADNTVAICLVCRKEGHDGDGCPLSACPACGEYGHLSGACPTQRRCSRCQGLGHQVNTCTSKLKSSRTAEGIWCDICRVNTHDPKGCELLWRTFTVPSSSEMTRIIQAVPVFCYVCGLSGHYGPECTMRPRGWTAPKTGRTFSLENMLRYVDENSILKAIDPPERISIDRSRGYSSRAREKHSVYTTDEDDEDHFLNPRVSKAAPRGRMKTNIRFARDDPSHYVPPPPRPRSREGLRYERTEYDRSYRPRSRSPPRYPIRDQRERDDYRRPPPPPLPRGPPPSLRGRGGYRGRGRGSGGGESFRPLPSSGARAWRQHRI